MWSLLRPILFSLDAEKAHRLTLGGLHHFPRLNNWVLKGKAKHPSLSSQLTGMTLNSPVGLAAGLDKDGEAVTVWPALGFGFIELGTVTAHPQQGNEKPRMFRLINEKGIINRMGFNNKGSETLANNLQQLQDSGLWPNIPVGANVGKSKITPLEDAGEDYRVSIERLQGLVDYFTVNVSSPNTKGLRSLQAADKLQQLLETAQPAAKGKPVFVKFAPDMNPNDLDAAIEVVIAQGCSGIIATNTTNQRPDNTNRLAEGGGLSGAPLWAISKPVIKHILDQVDDRVPVIGVGGISSGQHAEELLNMGCAAVQLYSGLIFEGPDLVHRINAHLSLKH
jgi:dihydroorotate dehydrogenase